MSGKLNKGQMRKIFAGARKAAKAASVSADMLATAIANYYGPRTYEQFNDIELINWLDCGLDASTPLKFETFHERMIEYNEVKLLCDVPERDPSLDAETCETCKHRRGEFCGLHKAVRSGPSKDDVVRAYIAFDLSTDSGFGYIDACETWEVR